ncbi:effector-associated constant component EACC1 [Actinomadura scrupuli]|uniref:effector-associated constant component EACC1 n=1 Tax=Actinomadura scrupuli TaxID=559629 RepID=UPI003D97C00A
MAVVSISVSGAKDGEEELRSLDDWLSDTMRGRVTWQSHPPEPGHMGVQPHELVVALDEGLGPGVLADSLEIWLRRRGPEVKIMVRVGDQVTEVSALGDLNVAALLREALRAAGAG